MNWLGTLTILSVFASVALAFLCHWVYSTIVKRRIGQAGYKPKTLMTPNEVDFFHRLQKAIPKKFIVIPQVSMGALVDTKLLPAHPNYWDARREFSGKVCDFVVCDQATMKPQLVIELDDRMHNFNKDKLRDTLVAKAGYRTLRFWSRAKPDHEELKQRLAVALILN